MFKPNEIEAIPIELESQFKELENRIMQDIVRRLKNNGNDIIRSADWQLHRLSELGKSKKEIKQFISETLGLSEKEIDRIYSDVLEQGYAHDADLYKAVGKDMVPFAENKPLQQLISATIKQTHDELKNITQSLGFAVKQPDGTLKFQPIADYYQKTLDGAMLDIASGAFDYNTVLKRVVFEMTNSGLRSVDYASGWSNRVPVAARRALMTGFNQVVAKVNEDNAAELETDMYEISWHSGYRPDHWWGGKWYTHDQLVSICGLGTVTGLCGANCYHDYSPVISGISEPTYTQEQLDKMNAKEQEKRLFYGKEYNMYEATQRQRKLETAMRAQRQKIKLLEDGGADEDDIIVARAKYRGMSQEYTAFSKAMDLPQQRERVTIDGLGNIGVGKWKKQLKNKPKSGIITPGRDSMGLSIEIDDFTPCLVEKSTGKIVDTKYSIANKSELKSLKQKGWNFNWTADDLKDSDIYKLTLENDDTIQGLVAVKDMPNDYAVYLKLAESAPHNIGKNKKYDGVGGHLFAIAAKLSMDSGYGGFIYFEAKNMDLVKHYRESFGGRLIGGAHQYRMIIDEDSAEILLKKYTLKGE